MTDRVHVTHIKVAYRQFQPPSYRWCAERRYANGGCVRFIWDQFPTQEEATARAKELAAELGVPFRPFKPDRKRRGKHSYF